jgi:type VI secretion system protein ImpA
MELERLAEGKEATQFSEAEEPNWREVRDGCTEVFARGKHLRTAVLLTLAATKLEGYAGFRDGIKLVQGLCEQYWDQVFPQLDPEDNNDPTERINALSPFATPLATYGDKLRLLDALYASPLCDSRQLGRFTLRDIAMAAGTLAAADPDKTPATLKTIDLAFGGTDKSMLEEIAAAAEQAGESAKAIDKVFADKCGAGYGPDFKPLLTILKDAALHVRKRITAEGAGGAGGGATSGGAAGSGGGSGGGESFGGGAQGGGADAALRGEVHSPEDAITALDKVIQYYELREPSSPVPLIVLCAKQMVKRKFLDITKVLTPDAISVIERVAASGNEQASS